MQEEKIKINGLLFVLTCHRDPEQYDVFDENSKLVGYVRLWHGNIRCDYPNICGKKVYQEDVGEEWTFEFETDEQRMHYLTKAADSILISIEEEKRDKQDESRAGEEE